LCTEAANCAGLFRYWGEGVEQAERYAHPGYRKRGTVPVGDGVPNAFDLYDVPGNIWEWTAASWHDSATAPRMAPRTTARLGQLQAVALGGFCTAAPGTAD